jgi:hypothetical protein
MNRLNKDLAGLYSAAKDHKPEDAFSDANDGFALRIDDDITYCVIADVDSFLFEIKACAELMQKLFGLLYAHAGRPIPTDEIGERLRATLTDAGVHGDWFRKLAKARNFAAHEGTPYVAIDISQNEKWVALFMMKNLKRFDDPDTFFSISELQEIASGFSQATSALQRRLVELFQ